MKGRIDVKDRISGHDHRLCCDRSVQRLYRHRRPATSAAGSAAALQHACRIAVVNRIAAAIAEEIGIAAAETERIALEEASQSRIVEAIAVIVDAQFGKIFPPREHEPVSIPTVGSRTRAAPGSHGRFAESIVTIFLYTVTVGIKQKGDVAHPIQVIAQIPMNGVVPIEDFVRARPIYIPRYTAPYVVLQDRFPSIIHDKHSLPINGSFEASPEPIVNRRRCYRLPARHLGAAVPALITIESKTHARHQHLAPTLFFFLYS